MYEFDYARPKTIDEAVKLAQLDDARFLAGGMTLLPAFKQRLASTSLMIDLGAIADLRGISVEDDVVSIGAMTRHAEVAGNELVRKTIPALSDLAGVIGDQQVRHRGTIGGSVANNDPASDYPAAVLGLDATIHTDRRDIAAGDFFTGMFDTSLDEGEMITRFSFARPDFAAYRKFRSPISGYALIGTMVVRDAGQVRVAVTGGGHGVFRCREIEQALEADWSCGAVDAAQVPLDELAGDYSASVPHKAALIRTLVKKVLGGGNVGGRP